MRLAAGMIKSLVIVVMMFVMVIPMVVMLMVVIPMVVMLMVVIPMVVMLMVVMLMVVIPMVVIPMVVMLVIVMLVIVMLVIVMSILRGIVGCSGVNVEFYTGDSCASLSLKMKVAIAEFQFRELPFESGRGDSQIGQRANRHVATDPRKAVQVKDTHRELPTLKTGCYTRGLLKPRTAF
jgi:hypothetical protein